MTILTQVNTFFSWPDFPYSKWRCRWYWAAINGLPQGEPQGPFGISREAYQAAVQMYDEYFGTRGRPRAGH